MEEVSQLLNNRILRIKRNLKYAMQLAWAASPKLLLRYSVLGIFNAIMTPVSVYLGAQLVNQIAGAKNLGLSFNDILPIVLGLWITFVVQRAVGAYTGMGRNLYVRRVELEAERRLLAKAATVDLGHFDQSNWHDRLSRARRDVSWRPGDLTWSILGLSGNIVTIVLMSGLLASLHWLLVFLAISAALLSLLLESRVTSKMYKYFYQETPEERERQYLGDLMVQPKNTKEVRAFRLADYLMSRHQNLSEGLFAKRAQMLKMGSRISVVSGIVTGTVLALAYVFVAYKGIHGVMDPGAVVLVIGAFTSVSGTLSNISSTFIAVDQHTTFLDDYFSFLNAEPLLPVLENPQTLSGNPIESIAFENVHFNYPGSEGDALNGLDLCIRKNELIALVGENGAGKSTLIKLLLRFYDVNGGAIKVNGIDIRNLHPEEWRERIGVLFQDYATYELSIRDNVKMGRQNEQSDDEKIILALKDSKSEWLLQKMPQGLDSKVGRLFEGGHDLSGGEWQRLALSRIMYRNPEIWILDEPTASLDPEAEAAIFAELKENLKGKIGIVISHRFSTVRIADRIAVIQDGKISELGSHEELMDLGKKYANLFELQAKGYQ